MTAPHVTTATRPAQRTFGPGSKWTAEQLDTMHAMRERGCSVVEIGEALGMPRWRVKARLAYEGKERKREAAETDRKTRACLTCGHTFQSWGNGNRMCDLCRRGATA